MGDSIQENCGIGIGRTLHDAYSFTKSLQHRGREAVGLYAVGYRRIDAMKWIGTVDSFDVQSLEDDIFPSHSHGYHTFVFHVRYATKGGKDQESILEGAHPQVIGGKIENRGNHIIIRDCEAALVFNGQINLEYFESINEEVKGRESDTECLLHYIKKEGARKLIENIPGAFTLAFADKAKDGIIITKDRLGMRPGALGFKGGKYCMASEDIALRKNGANFVKELEAGCIHYLLPDGGYYKEEIISSRPKHCFFEWNYLSDVDSRFGGRDVRSVREALGEVLAEEFNPHDADYVTFLPRCPEISARVYAEKLGIPFKHLFYKIRKERSFQGSTQNEREGSIKANLHLLPEIDGRPIEEFLRGKTVILIDDSTIRATNSKRARELLYHKAGIKKAYLVNYTPQIGVIGEDGIERGCLFGVDMPPGDKFVAIYNYNDGKKRNRTLEEISEEIGMPVFYISKEGMYRAFELAGISRENLCSFCIGGKHPF